MFGGVQLLMIGDLLQLSPVIKENEWQLLKPFYKNGFFFSSHSYQQCNPITVELKHVYRQDNQKFIEILKLDENKLDAIKIIDFVFEDDKALLQQKFDEAVRGKYSNIAFGITNLDLFLCKAKLLDSNLPLHLALSSMLIAM